MLPTPYLRVQLQAILAKVLKQPLTTSNAALMDPHNTTQWYNKMTKVTKSCHLWVQLQAVIAQVLKQPSAAQHCCIGRAQP
jgi:hypothetical protein